MTELSLDSALHLSKGTHVLVRDVGECVNNAWKSNFKGVFDEAGVLASTPHYSGAQLVIPVQRVLRGIPYDASWSIAGRRKAIRVLGSDVDSGRIRIYAGEALSNAMNLVEQESPGPSYNWLYRDLVFKGVVNY